MTKEEVRRLYLEWTSKPSNEFCGCANHAPENKDVCERERAWRNYCMARDQYIAEHPMKETEKGKRIDLELFDGFEGLH